jgi:hypothetical protein
MPYDVKHALDHAEVAGWVLGVLDADDARDFQAHLLGCDQCQAAVAEFEPVAQGLKHAAPAVEPPADLAAKTLAAVQHAVLAGRPPKAAPAPAPNAAPALQPAPARDADLDKATRLDNIRPQPEPDRFTPEPDRFTPEKAKAGKASRWWHIHWSGPLFPVATALAAAAVTAAAFIAVQTLAFAAPAVAATFSLRAPHDKAASGTATVRHHDGGWAIQLTVAHLPALRPDQFYECWYEGAGSRPGHPDLITAGTFVVNRSGSGTFTMWSAANPAKFQTMQITAEQPGDTSQPGAVLLSGTARGLS